MFGGLKINLQPGMEEISKNVHYEICQCSFGTGDGWNHFLLISIFSGNWESGGKSVHHPQ
jgi:hypothetical protein